jgi:hypothetical protein
MEMEMEIQQCPTRARHYDERAAQRPLDVTSTMTFPETPHRSTQTSNHHSTPSALTEKREACKSCEVV